MTELCEDIVIVCIPEVVFVSPSIETLFVRSGFRNFFFDFLLIVFVNFESQ